jgi:hypothetical protein
LEALLALVPLDRVSPKSQDPVSPASSLVRLRLSPKLSNSEPRVALREGNPGSSLPVEVVEVVAAFEVGVPPDPEEVGVMEGG